MSPRLRTIGGLLAAAALSASIAAAATGALTASAHPNGIAGRAYGLTSDQRLTTFSLISPRTASTPKTITGLTSGDPLVGIDIRPENGTLIGLSRDGRVFVINPGNGAATMISQLNTALVGTNFGIDFNPTVDRLRIVSDTGQNLRANVDTGAVTTDTGLAFTPPTAATGVTAITYTNNDKIATTATGTVLYDIDTTNDRLVIQMPPNSGQLNVVGLTLADLPANVGFDIRTTTNAQEGAANVGWIVTGAMLHRINLESGQLIRGAPFPTSIQVVDIAIQL